MIITGEAVSYLIWLKSILKVESDEIELTDCLKTSNQIRSFQRGLLLPFNLCLLSVSGGCHGLLMAIKIQHVFRGLLDHVFSFAERVKVAHYSWVKVFHVFRNNSVLWGCYRGVIRGHTTTERSCRRRRGVRPGGKLWKLAGRLRRTRFSITWPWVCLVFIVKFRQSMSFLCKRGGKR